MCNYSNWIHLSVVVRKILYIHASVFMIKNIYALKIKLQSWYMPGCFKGIYRFVELKKKCILKLAPLKLGCWTCWEAPAVSSSQTTAYCFILITVVCDYATVLQHAMSVFSSYFWQVDF